MNNKPNPELIDEENPEWTAAMFNTAKTTAELLPQLANGNNEAVESFKRGWQEMLRGEYYPIETLWDDKCVAISLRVFRSASFACKSGKA